MIETIKTSICASIQAKSEILNNFEKLQTIEDIAREIVKAYRADKKVILMGNGGSASDAQHICAEFVGRFTKERRSLFAIALNTNVSNLTAIANDYGYDKVFSRQIEAFVREGDVVIGFSTSGNSENVNNALIAAKKLGAVVCGLSGKGGGKQVACCDYSLVVDSNSSATVQESHIMIGHILCGLVEDELF